MIDVKEQFARLVNAVKLGDSKTTHECLKQIIAANPPLKSNWLGVARMALLAGEVAFARKALEAFVPQQQVPITEKLQRLAMLIEAGQVRGVFEDAKTLAKAEPTSPEINHFLSTVALQLGDIELARTQAELVLTQWPNSGQAWLILVATQKFKAKDPIIKRMEAVKPLVDSSKNSQSISSFYAALSKVLVDLGEVEQAFEAATKSNSVKLATQTYDAQQDSQNVNFIESQFAQLQPSADTKKQANSTNPIFVIGLPRSGTSLLEQILCSHSKVIDGGEFNGMERAARCLTKGAPIGSSAEQLAPYNSAQNIEKIRGAYLKYAQQRFGDTGAIVDKSLNNNRYLWLIKQVFPDSPIIYIKRNALDSAWSCFRTHFSNGLNWSCSLQDIGAFFAMEEKLSKLWLQKYAHSIFSMDYETLVEQPEDVMKNLCDFCGIEYESDMLDFHLSQRPVFTASVTQVRENLHQQAVGQWQKVEHHLKPFIEAYKQQS